MNCPHSFVLFVVSVFLLAFSSAEICQPENRSCQEGFVKHDLTEKSFMCKSARHSEWRGSYYHVYNTTRLDVPGNKTNVYGLFKNEIDISAIVLRACLSEGSYVYAKIYNPAIADFRASVGMTGTGQYVEYVVNSSFLDFSTYTYNGTVQNFPGDMDVSTNFYLFVLGMVALTYVGPSVSEYGYFVCDIHLSIISLLSYLSCLLLF